ncbi:MAG: nuclease [Gordonia sp.]|nr:nuclease [Gordonia sp. (in: high G+C Gram-positive bacteria)]
MRVFRDVPLRIRGATLVLLCCVVVSGCSAGQAQVNTPHPTSGITTALPVEVVSVIDGDTLRVQMPGDAVKKVRVIGIDTPEIAHPPDSDPAQCYGPEAADLTAQLVPEGTVIRLESDPVAGEQDRYGRRLAHVWLPDGLLLSRHLLQAGAAREFTYQGQNYSYRSEFRSDERAARANATGLWGRCERP